MSKKKDKQFISFLKEELRECEWKANLVKNADPNLSAFWSYKALQFRLKIYEKTETPERYKELYKHWVKGVVSLEEYANIDKYFEEKYGITASKEDIA